MFSANLNFCFHGWTRARRQHPFFWPCGWFCQIARCKRPSSSLDLCYLLCCSDARPHEDTSRHCVWGEDSTVVPNETEEWWRTETMCWQNGATLQLLRWTTHWLMSLTLTEWDSMSCNSPRDFSSPCISSQLEKHSCLLESAGTLGAGWAALTGYNFPKRTKLGKGDNSPSFSCSVSWPALTLWTLWSFHPSHESVSEAPLCSGASNAALFPEDSLNQYTPISHNIKTMTGKENNMDDLLTSAPVSWSGILGSKSVFVAAGACALFMWGKTRVALWEKGELRQAGWCFGQHSAGKQWVLTFKWMLLKLFSDMH